MLGTIVNCIAIIVGSIFGMLLKEGIEEKIREIVMNKFLIKSHNNDI